MNKRFIFILIVISGLSSACDSEGDKIREELDHIADTAIQEEAV